MRLQLLLLLLISSPMCLLAQEKQVNPRPMTMEEYEKAKQFAVKDLDNDTYVKIDNAYILDRYEMRKPYFVTGDDNVKKRIDLYKVVAKDGLQELGLMIFYTTEKGTVYKACMPNFTADGKVWEKYFEDIHAIDRTEKNFVLKLSYILSKEMGFQLYKSLNAGKDLSEEAAHYGNDICFTGNQGVGMENGSIKMIQDIEPGDRVMTIDALTQKPIVVTVKKLIIHEEKNYAIIRLTVKHNDKIRVVELTPNHPVQTLLDGKKNAGSLSIGERVFAYDPTEKRSDAFTLVEKTEYARGRQKVYNIETDKGTTLVVNNVVVLQK
jgi:hypothetical protein